jgi:hypothetical protein
MEASLTLDNERTLSLESSDNDNSPKPQAACSDAPTHPRIDQSNVRLSGISDFEKCENFGTPIPKHRRPNSA